MKEKTNQTLCLRRIVTDNTIVNVKHRHIDLHPRFFVKPVNTTILQLYHNKNKL